MKLLLGDCKEKLKELEDNSIDAIVTDPPYGLSFMGKKWDYDVPSIDIWKECLRVLKPGGYLLSFAGTRTQHRMAVNIEDAGFEIRDMIAWVYGSGFPKSLNIGKAVDKLQGNEREETDYIAPDGKKRWGGNSFSVGEEPDGRGINKATKGTSEFEGWGTALKPAVESITVALKPFNTVPYCDIIEREVKELLCQLQQLAKTVVKSSKSNQADTKGELDIAQWSVEEYTSIQEGLSVLMGMLQLESERTLSLNIVLSWLSILGEVLKLESKSTIEMKISLITELRTLNSLEWGNISQSIIQAKDSQINIQNADVLTVIGLFIGLELKLKAIQEPFVVENAILREREKTFAPNLSPIIMSRKPLSEKTVAENCLKWGVGGINIDECRVGTEEKLGRQASSTTMFGNGKMTKEDVIDNRDFIKNPYVLEFLNLPANLTHKEKEIEKEIINHLQLFLLELGKGFAFVAQQKLIRTETSDFFIDLVFYNYLLKCFVIIDIKSTKLTHQDIGQLDMYVRMFDEIEKLENDNPTIGILLCADTDNVVAKYSVLNDNKNLFASKYQLYLPTEEELQKIIKKELS